MSSASLPITSTEGPEAGHEPSAAGSHEELARAHSRLQEEMRVRTVALASAAHELKTPLSVLTGYLEVLLAAKLGPLTERQSQVLKAMQASSVRLQQFIQDFLTYTF
jgi:signal transduction histidine kinase